MIFRLPSALLLLLLWGCARAGGYELNVTFSNLSDSYIYPYRIGINGVAGVPVELLRCSDGRGSGSSASTETKLPPSYVVVEWEHLLTRKSYRARIELDNSAGEWWRIPVFRNQATRRPLLVIQWRGERKVGAMLVADFLDFSKGRLELGEAEGVEIPRPKWGPKLYLTYEDLQQKPGGRYWAGTIYRYDRTQDGSLPPDKRFGCPRLPDGRVDVTKLPPEKLPILIGENGEHIPCKKYFCADKRELIKKIRADGWRTYPPDKTPPPVVFLDAPNPRPAW